eukprot:1371796-Amphidinium_carterae.1
MVANLADLDHGKQLAGQVVHARHLDSRESMIYGWALVDGMNAATAEYNAHTNYYVLCSRQILT